jgi:hypothetical protein
MWGLARAYTDIDKQKAILVYSDLLKSVETIKERNMFNDIVLKHKIAMLSEETGNFSEALKLCNEILDIDIKSDKIRIKAEDRLNRVVKLKNKLNSLGIK